MVHDLPSRLSSGTTCLNLLLHEGVYHLVHYFLREVDKGREIEEIQPFLLLLLLCNFLHDLGKHASRQLVFHHKGCKVQGGGQVVARTRAGISVYFGIRDPSQKKSRSQKN